MAASVATATLYGYPRGVDNTQRYQILRGTISFTYGTYPVGGFAINWGSLVNGDFGEVESIPIAGVSSTVQPVEVDVHSGSATPGGFVYVVDTVTGNLHVFISANSSSGLSGPLVEGVGTNANVPAALVNDSATFTAYFVRG